MKQVDPKTSPVPLLILEDNPAFLHLLREGLTYGGYEVTAAQSGREGLRILQEHSQKPQLILCDFHLTDMTACDLLQAVNEDTLLREIPTVIFSGSVSSNCLCPGFETQIKAQLVKPFTLDNLMTTIEKVLAASDKLS